MNCTRKETAWHNISSVYSGNNFEFSLLSFVTIINKLVLHVYSVTRLFFALLMTKRKRYATKKKYVPFLCSVIFLMIKLKKMF